MSEQILIWMALGIMLALGSALYVLLEKKIRQEAQAGRDQFLQLAKEQFAAEQTRAAGELEVKRQSVESSVKGLNEKLAQFQQLIREFEQDRTRKYGNLENELKNASQATMRLQESTAKLNNILGNVKLRGQWGERMAEDIIRYAGLVEGINYRKQKKLSASATQPDYTFFLPDQHIINMDVKFPIDNYVKMVNSDDPGEKDGFQKDFLRNVKDRIRELQNRDYINPGENTLDFVLLFVPNEQVFAVIQEKMPDVMDLALQQKVVLCSPFTLFAVLSIVRQAYEHFRYEKDIKKIIVLIEQFTVHYERFKDRFDDVGTTIGKLDTQYHDLKNKSFKQLDTKVRHIDAYKKGHPNVVSRKDDLIDLTPPEYDDGIVLP